MVTDDRALLPAALAAVLLLVTGCGKGDLAQSFSGGSSSKDKQPIASTVKPPSPQAPGAQPAPAEPAVAEKVADVAAAQLEDGKPIRKSQMEYRSTRVRDPFRSLIQDSEERADLVDLSVVTLVAIVMGDAPFCVVEDAEGIAYVLRKGDRVKNGRIVTIKAESVVASQTLLGFTSTVQLKLDEGKRSHG